MNQIARRKVDHLDLATSGDVGFKHTTSLFDCVKLIHNALPELDFGEVNLATRVLGRPLRAPLLIAAMTGGTARSAPINRDLAALAEARGYAFGLGSQRAMLTDPEARASFQVRGVAPSVLVLGNIGAVQAARMSRSELAALVDSVGADALCVHLNPAMELIQAHGDRDFRGCLESLGRLARDFPVPVIAKETGCGLSGEVAARLAAAGVRHVDVSGAGGTSWVALESLRAHGQLERVGQTFAEWGIPTAASVAQVAAHGFETVFATGGIATGLDVAKAIALGASAAGIARAALQAHAAGGRAAASALFERIETELRMAMLLVGASDLDALRRAPRIIVGELERWMPQG